MTNDIIATFLYKFDIRLLLNFFMSEKYSDRQHCTFFKLIYPFFSVKNIKKIKSNQTNTTAAFVSNRYIWS
jgi:hypothetical protein